LAAPVDSGENTDPLLLRLEAKLDLALEMGLLLRYPERPPLTTCRLGLEAVGWHADQPLAIGSSVMLLLFPHPDSALVLYLAACISECVANPAGGVQLTARLSSGLDEYTLSLWEKWVFRRHRRAILER